MWNNRRAEVTLCAPRLISWLYRHTSNLFIVLFLWVYCLHWVRLGWLSVCVIHCLWFIGSLLSAHQSTPQGSHEKFHIFFKGINSAQPCSIDNRKMLTSSLKKDSSVSKSRLSSTQLWRVLFPLFCCWWQWLLPDCVTSRKWGIIKVEAPYLKLGRGPLELFGKHLEAEPTNCAQRIGAFWEKT